MEETDDKNTAKRYRKLTMHIENGFKNAVGIKKSMYEHTCLLWTIGAMLLYVTLVQFHDPWQGDMWAFPDHEWALRHEWVDTVDEILGSCDEEGYMLGHFYNDSEHRPSVDPEHASHALQIQRVLESRWETTLLTWALHLNFLLVLTIFARYYFFKARQSFKSIFFLMWIFMFSSMAQFVALALRTGVLVFSSSLWGMAGTFFNSICLCIELLAFVELYKSRTIIMFMNKQFIKLPSEHQEQINQDISDKRAHQDRMKRRRSKKKNAFYFVDSMVHILTSARDSITGDCMGASLKEKTL